MKLPERVAQSVVEAVLPGARMQFRYAQSNQEYDFDLLLSDGERAALEVTASADRRHVETLAVLANERKGGQFVQAKQCQASWYVHPEEGARIDRIRSLVDEYLRPIEEAGITEFLAPLHSFEHEPVRRIWQDLRIEAGSQTRWSYPRQIGIAAPGRGGWVDPAHIVDAVEAEARKPDNAAKLLASGLPQRHLLVFVDSSNHHAWGPMVQGMSPPRDPDLPTAFTHAWAVSSGGALHRFRALSFERHHGWQDFGFVRAVVEPDS